MFKTHTRRPAPDGHGGSIRHMCLEYIYIYVYIYMYMYMYAYIYMKYVHMNLYTDMYMYVYIYIYIYTVCLDIQDPHENRHSRFGCRFSDVLST